MPTLDFAGTAATTTSETVRLVPCPSVTSESLIQERTFTAERVRIRTSFYWPKHPGGITVGYTAPLEGWVETRIEGLTTEPLVLGGEYSQTYRPEHHNFAEQFIFEPQLDVGVSAVQLAELRAANVQLIHVFWGEGAGRVTVLGLDEQFRQLP